MPLKEENPCTVNTLYSAVPSRLEGASIPTLFVDWAQLLIVVPIFNFPDRANINVTRLFHSEGAKTLELDISGGCMLH